MGVSEYICIRSLSWRTQSQTGQCRDFKPQTPQSGVKCLDPSINSAVLYYFLSHWLALYRESSRSSDFDFPSPKYLFQTPRLFFYINTSFLVVALPHRSSYRFFYYPHDWVHFSPQTFERRKEVKKDLESNTNVTNYYIAGQDWFFKAQIMKISLDDVSENPPNSSHTI